ncbi:PH domain-containing protein [Halobacillus litoralis]|uniref:PH domain-containing protein n=1 Tax=Halobacillus litoralis TaxID=45668 RepID=UPI001CD2AB36|nr:PH domain-containing protein [Halobacillus litoralis]MCA0972181.1 PH domain-containing protein [Halobacillus litoralis]
MFGLKVKENGDTVVISWQLSKVEIPKDEITAVTLDETYGGEEKTAMRIGFPYATTERILIKTTKQNYLLFTNNRSIKDKIERILSQK